MNQSHKNLRHGELASDGEVERLGLSPKPISVGRYAIDVSSSLNKTEDGLLEFRSITGTTLYFRVFILVIIWMFVDIFIPEWIDVFTGLWSGFPIPLFSTIAFGGMLYFLFKLLNYVVSRPPVRIHPQRQSFLLQQERDLDNKPQIPKEFFKGDAHLFMMGFGFIFLMIGLSSVVLFIEGNRGLFNSITCALTLIIGFIFLKKTLPPWIKYLKDLRDYQPKTNIIAIPWESIHIEYQSFSGVNYTGLVSLQNITFSAELPKDEALSDDESIEQEPNKFEFSMPVHSREEALSLYELLRDFMENGAEGIEHTAANQVGMNQGDLTRAGYKRLIAEKAVLSPIIYPFWRLINIVTLRYLMHWYLEYCAERAVKKSPNFIELNKLSKPIPKEEWVKQSDELTEINKKVRELYAKGYSWESAEVQGVILENNSVISANNDTK